MKKETRKAQLSLFDFQQPTMPKLDTARCHVKSINHETASRMVEDYHYAGRTPSIILSFGLYVDSVLSGVITYGIPPQRLVLACCGEEYIPNALELNRLFVFDTCGRNSESWFLGKTFKLMEKDHKEFFILVSYADTGHNHIGYIYQATNWIYTGLHGGNSELMIDGKVQHPKSVFNKYGTHGLENLKAMGVKAEKIIQGKKHRYVYFLGNRSQRKKMRKLLKWEVIDQYPKASIE